MSVVLLEKNRHIRIQSTVLKQQLNQKEISTEINIAFC